MGWENLLLGFQVAMQPFNLGLAVLGITLGTTVVNKIMGVADSTKHPDEVFSLSRQ